MITFPDCPRTDCFWLSGLVAIATRLIFLESSDRTGALGVDDLIRIDGLELYIYIYLILVPYVCRFPHYIKQSYLLILLRHIPSTDD